MNLKSIFFFLFILFCSYESLTHLLDLSLLRQPRKKALLQDYMLLSPNSLVFDRREGFFYLLMYKLYFEDGEIKNYKFVEANREINTYLERIILRRTFVSYSNVKAIQAIFCNPESILLKPENIQKKIVKVEVNYLLERPLKKELVCQW